MSAYVGIFCRLDVATDLLYCPGQSDRVVTHMLS